MLGSAAQDIGKVTETIAEISAQTNLLALNATIEAARAGEAGKGFAVVANEIKDLARQTATATGEIKDRIEGIQSSTEITVQGIRKISEIITEIDAIVSGIAVALEEQSATMSELTTNIAEAGTGIGEVSENVAQSSVVSQQISRDISQLNQSVADIAGSTGLVAKNAEELNRLADSLRQLINKFSG
jgi:methyl-accepting chemotaxis protein